MENVKIRLATINDISRINELFIQMIKYVNEQNRKNGILVDEEVFKDGYEDGFLASFIVSEDNFILVAELNNSVVGYLSCEEKDKYSEESFIYLDDFCVDDNYRGFGIGTKLVKAVDTYALENQINHLKLHVDNKNERSKRFYNNLGFKSLIIDSNRTLMKKQIEKIYNKTK